jgi:hypothetical protein
MPQHDSRKDQPFTYTPRDIKSGGAFEWSGSRTPWRMIILGAAATGILIALVASCPWLASHIPELW